MKFPSKAQEDAHQRAVIIAGAKGFFGGLAVATPLSFILQRRWAYYRSLPPNLKLFGVLMVAVPAFAISSDRASLAFERSQWDDAGTTELETVKSRDQARWESLSATEKAADVFGRHPYSIMGGTWATSMVGIYAWLSRDPMATPFQKITQTRVWAQGLTLGMLIASAALMHSQKHREANSDHSWREMIVQEEAEEKRRKAMAGPT